ncbi:hypothetical protein H6F51_21790 [Cyanobacteria bacterium FACHB-DQ100]|nr:hypothetical protein [Cyanobacteria bacterium FACHB-DQ100]
MNQNKRQWHEQRQQCPSNHSALLFPSDASSSTGAELLSQRDRDTILNLLTQINDLLPFLRDLSAEERKSMLGMGNKNRIFAGKVLEVI